MHSPSKFARQGRRLAMLVVAALAVAQLIPITANAANPSSRSTRLRPLRSEAPAPQAEAQKSASSVAGDGEGLDAARAGALELLYKQLLSGTPFSAEESEILTRFAAGQNVSVLDADVVISRAIYTRHISATEMTREQAQLYDAYAASVARRERDIADVKAELVARRVAEEATSPRAPQVPPSNDMCAGAIVIPPAGPFPHLTAVTADITDATLTGDPAVPSCTFLGGPVSRGTWYTFTPSTTALYTISACADAPTATTVDDTVIGIYTSAGGCAGPFTEIPTAGGSDGCDDDTCATESLQSVINTNLTSGTTYYIVVFQYDTPAPTAGNTAVQLRVGQVVTPANDTCAGAIALTVNTPLVGQTNSLTTNDYQLSGATCFTGLGNTSTTAPGRDVAYSFTAPTAGLYSFKVYNYSTALNPVLYIASSCPGGPAPQTVTTCLVAANRNTSNGSEEVVCANLTMGQMVFAIVDELGAATAGSQFTIEVNACTLETEANDTPATAQALTCGIEGAINIGTNPDFYNLGTPAAGSRVFAIADGVAANGASGDFDLRVTTTTDTLEYDDANNVTQFGSNGPNVAGTPLTGVASFLRVSHFSSLVSEPYRLYAVVQPPIASAAAELEPYNTIGTAHSPPSNYFSGALAGPAPSTDQDVYAFTATAGEIVVVGLDLDPLRNNTPINGAFELLDPTGAVILQINDGGSTSSTTASVGTLTGTTPNSPAEAATYRVPTTGTYYVRVGIGTTSTSTTGAGDYLLSISRNCAIAGGITPTISINDVSLNEGNAGTTAFTFTVSLSQASLGTVTVNFATADGTATLADNDYATNSGTVTFAPGVTSQMVTVNVNGDITNEPNETFFVNLTSPMGATILDGQGQGTIVNDDAACMLTCPANVTQGNDANQCGAVVNYPAPTPTGSCGTVTCAPVSGSFFPVGTTTVTCTAMVGPTCTFTVTVNDTQAPAITCPANVTQANDANQCGAVVNFPAPTVSDNCPGVGMPVCSPVSGSFFPVGTTTVTCTVSDASPNSADGTCMFTVTVNDTQAPTITCPANVTVGNTPNQCGAVVNFPAPTVSDNCPGVGMPVCSPVSGSFFPKGTTTVTCTVSDASANSPDATCMFTVTVNDTQPPAITCPANVTVPGGTVTGCTLSSTVTYAPPTASDNCPGVTTACVPASGTVFAEGTTTVTCTATDAVGNTATCSFTVTVTGVGVFGACAVDDASGDTFSIVTDPASPNVRFWRYRVAATGEVFCGIASAMAYYPNRSLTATDGDDPSLYMNANLSYSSNSGTVRVIHRPTGRQFVLKDRNLSNNPPCQ
jgi:hypothetical protein